MYENISRYLDDMSTICELSCLTRPQWAKVIELAKRVPYHDIEAMLDRSGRSPSAGGSASAPPARPSNGLPSALPVPGGTPGVSQSLPARLERLICSPITGVVISALATRIPAARAAALAMTAYCAGDGDIDVLTDAFAALRRAIGGERDPIPQLGAGAPLAIGIHRMLTGDTSGPEVAAATRMLSNTSSATVRRARADDPTLDTAPFLPIGNTPTEASDAWALLEASTRGANALGASVGADLDHNGHVSVGEAGAVATAMLMRLS